MKGRRKLRCHMEYDKGYGIERTFVPHRTTRRQKRNTGMILKHQTRQLSSLRRKAVPFGVLNFKNHRPSVGVRMNRRALKPSAHMSPAFGIPPGPSPLKQLFPHLTGGVRSGPPSNNYIMFREDPRLDC